MKMLLLVRGFFIALIALFAFGTVAHASVPNVVDLMGGQDPPELIIAFDGNIVDHSLFYISSVDNLTHAGAGCIVSFDEAADPADTLRVRYQARASPLGRQTFKM